MKLKVLEPQFSVCKIADLGAINWDAPFCFVARTDEECSLVCPLESVPMTVLAREDGWRGLRIEGTLDFSLVGILADISGLLARHEIPIFAVSTYNTDYILVKEDKLSDALYVLRENGYQIV